MTSQIDITKPVFGSPTTQSVRDNFTTASNEITALQNATTGSPFLPLAGGTMLGSLYLANDPSSAMMPVTLQYAQANFGAPGGGPAVPEAPSDGVLYGRQTTAWVQAASPADITAAINAKWVQATETALGVAMVATQALVNAGTDDLAFVTSKKLAARIAAAVGAYVPLAGNSTITGNLTFAPTGAGANVSLTLTRPDANGTPMIAANQGATPLWQIICGTPSSNNFVLLRQPGAAQTAPIYVENSTGFVRIGDDSNGVWAGHMIGAGSPATLGGAITASSPSQDSFQIQCRRLAAPNAASAWFDGSALTLYGPTHPSWPNHAAIFTGSQATGFKQFLFQANGGATFPQVLSVGAGQPIGIVGGQNNGGWLGMINSVGTIAFGYESSVNGYTIYANGVSSPLYNLVTAIAAPAFISMNWQTPNNVCALTDGTYPVFNVDSWSDEGLKTALAPTDVDALATVNAINVVQWDWQDDNARQFAFATEPHERIGFTYQDMVQHVPEATSIVKLPEPPPLAEGDERPPEWQELPSGIVNGKAGLVSNARLVPYLVRALQQMTARLAALEGTRQ